MKRPSRAPTAAAQEAIARASSASSSEVSGAKPSDPGDWLKPISLGDFAFSDGSDDMGNE
eukprot:16429081-Heterocapsa_arctica.AAC.1